MARGINRSLVKAVIYHRSRSSSIFSKMMSTTYRFEFWEVIIEGSPKGNVKPIKAKLFNFGSKTQYIGIDTKLLMSLKNLAGLDSLCHPKIS